jgi:hypothetical protein
MANGGLVDPEQARDNSPQRGFAMPLHDWQDDRRWDGVHLLWLAQLLDWVQPRLPPGFRAYVGSVPALTLEGTNGKPDVTVRGW